MDESCHTPYTTPHTIKTEEKLAESKHLEKMSGNRKNVEHLF